MKILYTKSEIMNSFEKIIDDVLLHNSKIKPGNISEIIMTDLLGIGKMIFSLWFQNIIGTGYKRSKIFMKTDTGDHRVKINMFKFNGLKTKITDATIYDLAKLITVSKTMSLPDPWKIKVKKKNNTYQNQ